MLTNVGQSHLKGLKTVQNIFKEKRSIIKGMVPGGTAIFNADDQFLRSLKQLKGKKISYALTCSADIVAKAASIIRQIKTVAILLNMNISLFINIWPVN